MDKQRADELQKDSAAIKLCSEDTRKKRGLTPKYWTELKNDGGVERVPDKCICDLQCIVLSQSTGVSHARSGASNGSDGGDYVERDHVPNE